MRKPDVISFYATLHMTVSLNKAGGNQLLPANSVPKLMARSVCAPVFAFALNEHNCVKEGAQKTYGLKYVDGSNNLCKNLNIKETLHPKYPKYLIRTTKSTDMSS